MIFQRPQKALLWSKGLRVHNQKLIFLFLNQNVCCGYSKEVSQWGSSFEHPNYMFKVMGKKILFTILHSKILFILTYGCSKILNTICLLEGLDKQCRARSDWQSDQVLPGLLF